MHQIFPKWANKLPPILILALGAKLAAITFFFWYWGSPKFIEVGYAPKQPVPYSHKLHAGDLGMDCRYCHVSVETSHEANIPSTQTCMNCHSMIGADRPTLQTVRDSWSSGKSIEWVRVHKVPEYAFFNHSVHITAGVGCESCHGNVAQMEVVSVSQPISMGWCLDCHRNPDQHLRPKDQITTMGWQPPANQAELGARYRQERKLKPPQDCAACHY